MNANAMIPVTQNEGWGFSGTMGEHAPIAWPLAMATIEKYIDEEFDAIRAFLDSKFGRHFADDVHNAMHGGLALAPAIEATTQKWMEWTTGRSLNRLYGIPKGLACLEALVIHCSLIDEGS
uniref:hypothetical protein n=1 Tax=Paraburkholderia heleia TaxID=634127 RepID=UPI002AB6EDAB